MRFLLYLIVAAALNACSKSSEISSLINLNNQTSAQIDNANKMLLNYMDHKSMDNPAKYGAAYDKMKEYLSLYKSIYSNDSVCARSFDSFIEVLRVNSLDAFPEMIQPIKNCLLDVEFSPADSLMISSARLNAVSAYNDFLLNFQGDYFGGSYKFIALHDFPIAIDEDKYSFALINKDVQEHENKNFSIDSIAFNGKPVHLQYQVMPYVCSNISIEIENPGKYEVFGHADIFDPKYVWKFPFSHEFVISE